MENKKLTEIVRSYSRKINLGNYEVADFFCSRKEECEEDVAEVVSKQLHNFCKQEVMYSIELLKKEKDNKLNAKSIKLEKKEKQMDFGDEGETFTDHIEVIE